MEVQIDRCTERDPTGSW